MASKNPPEHDKKPHQHNRIDPELDRAPHEAHGARLAGERGSLAQGVETGGISPGKTGGANLA